MDQREIKKKILQVKKPQPLRDVILSAERLALPMSASYAPEKLGEDFVKYLEPIALLFDGVRTSYAEAGAPEGMITANLKFSSSEIKKAGLDFGRLAHAIDHCGNLEAAAELLPGFSAWRRLSVHMPEAYPFKPTKGMQDARQLPTRQIFRQAINQIGAKLILVVSFVDEEDEQAGARRRGLSAQGFGQIQITGFDDENEG